MMQVLCMGNVLPGPIPIPQDTQFQDLKRLLYNSDNPLMKELFPDVCN